MPYTKEELSKYFAPEDNDLPYYSSMKIYENCTVTPLIEGLDFFGDLASEIDSLGSNPNTTQGVYIAGWWLDSNFNLSVGESLLNRLKAKQDEGVDVRVLAWVNDYVFDTHLNLAEIIFQIGDIFSNPTTGLNSTNLNDSSIQEASTNSISHINYLNLEEVRKLRDAGLKNCMINYLDHPLGAAHAKFILIFDGGKVKAYTGGMDLLPNRLDYPSHSNGWHDIQFKIEGEVCDALFKFYKDLWQSILNREYNPIFYNPYVKEKIQAKTGEETAIQDNRSFVYSEGNMIVQSLRTFPQYSWPWFIFTKEDSIIDAPKGKFEFQIALKTAIENAQKYIYIEDQGFYSREIYFYLRDALINNNELKIIMMHSPDPADNSSNYPLYAINEYLFKGLTSSQIERVKMFGAIYAIHSKVWIIDDLWVLGGSANFYNRSLYIDIEHSISFSDLTDGTENKVRKFRKHLWSHHFGLSTDDEQKLDGLNDFINFLWGKNAKISFPKFSNSLLQIPQNLLIYNYKGNNLIYENKLINSIANNRKSLGIHAPNKIILEACLYFITKKVHPYLYIHLDVNNGMFMKISKVENNILFFDNILPDNISVSNKINIHFLQVAEKKIHPFEGNFSLINKFFNESIYDVGKPPKR